MLEVAFAKLSETESCGFVCIFVCLFVCVPFDTLAPRLSFPPVALLPKGKLVYILHCVLKYTYRHHGLMTQPVLAVEM